MNAAAFKPGQKIRFPEPFDGVVAYFERIYFDSGIPVIVYRDESGDLKQIKGYDLFDISHA